MAFSVKATMTDQARQRIINGFITGESYQITKFSVGDGGHSQNDPTVALAPDPGAVTCPSYTYTYGPLAINSAALISLFCAQIVCVLTTGQANAPLSSICIWATKITGNSLDDPEVGQDFLFAVGNFPLKVKTSGDEFEIDVLLQD